MRISARRSWPGGRGWARWAADPQPDQDDTDTGTDESPHDVDLPRAWLREEGIDPQAWLANPAFTPAIGRVVARLLEIADILYARADAGIGELPMVCRPGIGAARLLYAEIGHQVLRHGGDSVSRCPAESGLGRLLDLFVRIEARQSVVSAPR